MARLSNHHLFVEPREDSSSSDVFLDNQTLPPQISDGIESSSSGPSSSPTRTGENSTASGAEIASDIESSGSAMQASDPNLPSDPNSLSDQVEVISISSSNPSDDSLLLLTSEEMNPDRIPWSAVTRSCEEEAAGSDSGSGSNSTISGEISSSLDSDEASGADMSEQSNELRHVNNIFDSPSNNLNTVSGPDDDRWLTHARLSGLPVHWQGLGAREHPRVVTEEPLTILHPLSLLDSSQILNQALVTSTGNRSGRGGLAAEISGVTPRNSTMHNTGSLKRTRIHDEPQNGMIYGKLIVGAKRLRSLPHEKACTSQGEIGVDQVQFVKDFHHLQHRFAKKAATLNTDPPTWAPNSAIILCNEMPQEYATDEFPCLSTEDAGLQKHCHNSIPLHSGNVNICANTIRHQGSEHFVCETCACAAHHFLKSNYPEVLESAWQPLCKKCSLNEKRHAYKRGNAGAHNGCICPRGTVVCNQSEGRMWLCGSCRLKELRSIQTRLSCDQKWRTGLNQLRTSSSSSPTVKFDGRCLCGDVVSGQNVGDAMICAGCFGTRHHGVREVEYRVPFPRFTTKSSNVTDFETGAPFGVAGIGVGLDRWGRSEWADSRRLLDQKEFSAEALSDNINMPTAIPLTPAPTLNFTKVRPEAMELVPSITASQDEFSLFHRNAIRKSISAARARRQATINTRAAVHEAFDNNMPSAQERGDLSIENNHALARAIDSDTSASEPSDSQSSSREGADNSIFHEFLSQDLYALEETLP